MNLFGVNSIGSIIVFFAFIWYFISAYILFFHVRKKYVTGTQNFFLRNLATKIFGIMNLIPIINLHPEDKKYTKLIWHLRLSLLIAVVYVILSIIFLGK